jgi:hypothetical protein
MLLDRDIVDHRRKRRRRVQRCGDRNQGKDRPEAAIHVPGSGGAYQLL